jgi:hypothetical protein
LFRGGGGLQEMAVANGANPLIVDPKDLTGAHDEPRQKK